MVKLPISIILLLAVVLFTCLSCAEKNPMSPNTQISDSKDDGLEFSYLFEKEILVKDASGKYYIVVKIKSNSEDLIEKAISQNPYIRIIDNNEKMLPSIQGDNESSILYSSNRKNDVCYHLTEKRNLPLGVQYAFHSSPAVDLNKAGCGTGGDPYQTASFQDDLATKVYTANNSSCGILFTYYSRGCCWYSFGWYKRGNRTLGLRIKTKRL